MAPDDHHPSGPPDKVRSIAATNWAFRWQVEREADLRFADFATRLTGMGAPLVITELARRASEDERRHATLCHRLALQLGAALEPGSPVLLPEIAPAELDTRERLTYEVVAACCIAETESLGTLTTLLAHTDVDADVRAALHEIARDEVQHARMGWAYLAWVGQWDLAFLGPLIPRMLSSARDLFLPSTDPDLESGALRYWGVLPHHQKREVFGTILQDVVLPGLDHLRVDSGQAREWLSAHLDGSRHTSVP